MRASGVRPRFSASSADISRTAAAPSLRPDALPAVTLPSFEKAGRTLAALHLDYETVEPWPVTEEAKPKGDLNDLAYYRVEKMRLSKDKTSLKVNDFLTLANIPPQVFDYKLGNRSALDWVIDQYQIKTDPRSGITNDPNNLDDETYILRLIKQVITVSLETVAIVNSLPPLDIMDDHSEAV